MKWIVIGSDIDDIKEDLNYNEEELISDLNEFRENIKVNEDVFENIHKHNVSDNPLYNKLEFVEKKYIFGR